MSNSEETLDIHTPENVAFGYHVAGIGSRFMASLIDTVILILTYLAVLVVYGIFLNALDLDPFGSESAWVAAILGLVLTFLLWGYYVLFEMMWNGQTPGKRWVGLRVLRADGTPITITESFIRNLVRLVDFLPVGYGVGILTMFIDSRARRLGDLAAGTLVVYDRAPISIQSLSERRSVNLAPRVFKNIPLDGFPLERLTNEDLALIEDFLLRRDQLTHRSSLANQILDTLHSRLGLPQPSVERIEAEDTLVAILHAVQAKAEEKQTGG